MCHVAAWAVMLFSATSQITCDSRGLSNSSLGWTLWDKGPCFAYFVDNSTIWAVVADSGQSVLHSWNGTAHARHETIHWPVHRLILVTRENILIATTKREFCVISRDISKSACISHSFVSENIVYHNGMLCFTDSTGSGPCCSHGGHDQS